jgi:hypothetical protein
LVGARIPRPQFTPSTICYCDRLVAAQASAEVMQVWEALVAQEILAVDEDDDF